MILVAGDEIVNSPSCLALACADAARMRCSVLVADVAVLHPTLPLDADLSMYRAERARLYHVAARTAREQGCEILFATESAREWAAGLLTIAARYPVTAVYLLAPDGNWLHFWRRQRRLGSLLALAPYPVHVVAPPVFQDRGPLRGSLARDRCTP